MSSVAVARAEMPVGADKILEKRTVETDNSNLLKFLKGDMAVLDVGCGRSKLLTGFFERLIL